MQEFMDFLGKQAPYDQLDGDDLARLGRHVSVAFYPAGSVVVGADVGPLDHLAVVRTGIVHVLDRSRVVDELGPGETFGQFSVFSGLAPSLTARAAVDTLLYLLPDPRSVLEHPDRLRFRGADHASSGNRALLASTVVDSTLRPVTDFMAPALWCDSRVTIREAARIMTAEHGSCVLIRLGEDLGIMTDSDCRRTVATGGISVHAPVSAIASTPALTISTDATAASAFLSMVHSGVHHLVVVNTRGDPVGVCRAIDLAAAEIRDPLTVRSAIETASDLETLARAGAQLRPTTVALHGAGVPALRIGALLSAMMEAVLEKCIAWTEPFASDAGEHSWLVLGSLARREPLPASDVDTALVWTGENTGGRADSLRAAAEAVLGDLERCGLARCPDGANATNPLFSRHHDQWIARSRQWREHPEAEGSLLLGSMQADSRPVTGLVVGRRLHDEIRTLPGDDAFVRRALGVAVAHKPPVGFVKDFIVDHEGTHRGQLNLKRGGLLPITGIGRWIGLRTHTPIASTQERLSLGREAGLLTDDEADQLSYAHQEIFTLLFARQVEALRHGTEATTWLDPRSIDSLRRRQLRRCFKAIAQVQERLEAEWLALR